MLYLEWIDKQKICREKLIVCGIPLQFLSGSVANPVSVLSHVHPFPTMEGDGGEVEGWRGERTQHSVTGALSMS